jgi:hypothetical protein
MLRLRPPVRALPMDPLPQIVSFTTRRRVAGPSETHSFIDYHAGLRISRDNLARDEAEVAGISVGELSRRAGSKY